MAAVETVDVIQVMDAIDRYCAGSFGNSETLMEKLSELPNGLLLFLCQFYDFITDGNTDYTRRTYDFIMCNICELLLRQHHLVWYNSQTCRLEFSVSGHFILENFKRENCYIGWNNGLDITIRAFNEIFGVNESYSDYYETTDFNSDSF